MTGNKETGLSEERLDHGCSQEPKENPPKDYFASASDQYQWAVREALSRRGAEAREGAEFDFAEPLAPLPQKEGLLKRGFEESVRCNGPSPWCIEEAVCGRAADTQGMLRSIPAGDWGAS